MPSQSLSSFIVTRIRDGVAVLLLVTLLIFVLGHLVGNPAKVMAPVDASEEQIKRLEHQLGLDRPFHEQLVSYFGALLHGDFGESLWQNRPAIDVVLEALPATLLLTTAA